MTRREFALAFFFRPQSAGVFRLEVLEVFGVSPKRALLVHHADEASRAGFIRWLRDADGTIAQFGAASGAIVRGAVYRVKMCFGRGLIVLDRDAPVQLKEILTVIRL